MATDKNHKNRKKKKDAQPRYVCDGVEKLRNRKRYVRAWREGRDWVIQLWEGTKPEGEPRGDWSMPGELPLSTAIAQADLQTPYSVN